MAESSPDPTLLDEVAELARRETGWSGSLAPEMRLVEDLGLDSLRLLALAVAVEDHFRLCLDEEDEAEISTVGDLVRIIERKRAAAGGEA